MGTDSDNYLRRDHGNYFDTREAVVKSVPKFGKGFFEPSTLGRQPSSVGGRMLKRTSVSS